MSNNRTREISFNDLNVQLDMIEQRMPRRNLYSARREDGKGGRIAAAANNVTMVSINISLSDPAAQSASHNKAMVDFPKLYHKAMKGSKFDAEDRGRLDKLVAKHRESLNLGDRAAFDRVFDAFNQSWGGKDFGDKDWDRFYKKTASLAHVPVPAAAGSGSNIKMTSNTTKTDVDKIDKAMNELEDAAKSRNVAAAATQPVAAAQPTPAVKEATPSESSHEYFDEYYAYLYAGDKKRMNEVRNGLNGMNT
jgi:hypothetical protein